MQSLSTNSAILDELRHLPLKKRQEVLDFIQFLRNHHNTPDTQSEDSTQRAWLTRNRAALIAYNERIEQRGLFSDGLRLF